MKMTKEDAEIIRMAHKLLTESGKVHSSSWLSQRLCRLAN